MTDSSFPPVREAKHQATIDRFFRGNEPLYQAFKQAAVGQFPHDAQAIEAALCAGDDAALRRTAHNLKSALRMLGLVAQEQKALALELAATTADAPAAELAWQGLQAELQLLMATPFVLP